MNKKTFLLFALGLTIALPGKAQWTNYDTQSTLRGVFGLANAAIESAERKKEMEILARQKVEFEDSFKEAMAEAKEAETAENWEEALGKYEEAAKLNCKYSYTDQHSISQKISSLYVKAGRSDDGPSILHNAEVTLADYSAYRYMRENPVFVNKKQASGVKILRVACSDRETRVEMEIEAYSANLPVYIKGTAYIKGDKGGKLGLASVQNVTMAPAKTFIPWPYQKLRFALIFPALPEEAKEFDLIEPSTTWQFKDIKCK
ncbi:MAG: hypothetical protein IJK15_09750 [Bacteroidaceae bacterium]|nr:hypothetical protein [Bacteroidaceae bacterium]MBR0433957.1 hypothetical protein [Bacteroidaceae bacterium]